MSFFLGGLLSKLSPEERAARDRRDRELAEEDREHALRSKRTSRWAARLDTLDTGTLMNMLDGVARYCEAVSGSGPFHSEFAARDSASRHDLVDLMVLMCVYRRRPRRTVVLQHLENTHVERDFNAFLHRHNLLPPVIGDVLSQTDLLQLILRHCTEVVTLGRVGCVRKQWQACNVDPAWQRLVMARWPRLANSPLVVALPWRRRYQLLSQPRCNAEKIGERRAALREERAFDTLCNEYRFAAHLIDANSGDAILTEVDADVDADRSIWLSICPNTPDAGMVMPGRFFREAGTDDEPDWPPPMVPPNWAPTGALAVTIFVERRSDGALTVLTNFSIDLNEFSPEDSIGPNVHNEPEVLFCYRSGISRRGLILPSLWEPIPLSSYNDTNPMPTYTCIGAELVGAPVDGAGAWRLSRMEFGFFWCPGIFEEALNAPESSHQLEHFTCTEFVAILAAGSEWA